MSGKRKVSNFSPWHLANESPPAPEIVLIHHMTFFLFSFKCRSIMMDQRFPFGVNQIDRYHGHPNTVAIWLLSHGGRAVRVLMRSVG